VLDCAKALPADAKPTKNARAEQNADMSPVRVARKWLGTKKRGRNRAMVSGSIQKVLIVQTAFILGVGLNIWVNM
jgi:hypothetical protein